MFGVLAGSYLTSVCMELFLSQKCCFPLTCLVIPIMSIPADVDARVTNLLQSSVKTVQEVMHILRESNLVTTMRLEPESVGVHPKNRDGLGLNSTDVHTLLANLLEVGFVGERVHAVAIEPASRDELLWNQQLVDGCNGKFGYMRSESFCQVPSHRPLALYSLYIQTRGPPRPWNPRAHGRSRHLCCCLKHGIPIPLAMRILSVTAGESSPGRAGR